MMLLISQRNRITRQERELKHGLNCMKNLHLRLKNHLIVKKTRFSPVYDQTCFSRIELYLTWKLNYQWFCTLQEWQSYFCIKKWFINIIKPCLCFKRLYNLLAVATIILVCQLRNHDLDMTLRKTKLSCLCSAPVSLPIVPTHQAPPSPELHKILVFLTSNANLSDPALGQSSPYTQV